MQSKQHFSATKEPCPHPTQHADPQEPRSWLSGALPGGVAELSRTRLSEQSGELPDGPAYLLALLGTAEVKRRAKHNQTGGCLHNTFTTNYFFALILEIFSFAPFLVLIHTKDGEFAEITCQSIHVQHCDVFFFGFFFTFYLNELLLSLSFVCLLSHGGNHCSC